MPKSKNRRKKKKKPIDYSSQKNRKTGLEKTGYVSPRDKKIGLARGISVLKERIEKDHPETNLKIGKFEHSVSGLILDYGKHHLDQCITEDEYRTGIMLLIACWNIGLVSDKDKRAQAISKLVDDICKAPEVEGTIKMLVKEKISFYNEYKYYVTDFELRFVKNRPYLSVASAQLDDEGNPIKE